MFKHANKRTIVIPYDVIRNVFYYTVLRFLNAYFVIVMVLIHVKVKYFVVKSIIMQSKYSNAGIIR